MDKSIIIVDIETTGFLEKGGKIIEIGIVKLNLDTGEVTPEYNSFVKEDGFDLSHTQGDFGWIFSNSDINYLDVDNATPLESQRGTIQNLFNKYKATAYNKAFDFSFLRDRGFNIQDLSCPMLLSTPIVKLPSKFGKDYKWPKVEEAWNFFFGDTGYVEAHRGLDDAMHEAKIVYELYKRGVFNISENIKKITKIDNIELDLDNTEFNYALDFVKSTKKLVYLTGKAGTGKTTFLKYIKDSINKNTVIVAPTGVAAINAGGVTIHSFFQLPFGPFIPNDSRLRKHSNDPSNSQTIYATFNYNENKRSIIKNMELLIIDEISMVRCDTLDVIDQILRAFRNVHHLPFGGVQVILIGDTFQLPPIVPNEQWDILKRFYQSQFFFSSNVIQTNKPVYIELKKIYRQNEQEFIDLLNKIRINEINQNDIDLLNSKYDPSFSGNSNDYILLATHNKIVDQINTSKLNELNTKPFEYTANLKGVFAPSNQPTEFNLILKEGAQIMFIKNDPDKKFYNGKIGKIQKLEEDQIVVQFENETLVKVKKATWDNIEYKYNKETKRIEENIIGSFSQYPIKLAWAITVHKSQGLTFEKVIADLGQAFAPGQVYVALSRCTSFNGLKLRSQIHSHAIKTDTKVLKFALNETPNTLIISELNMGKADFYYEKARKNIKTGKIYEALESFEFAIKYRNDINTDVFKKYVSTTFNRLYSFKDLFRKNIVLLTQKELNITDLSNDIIQLNETITNLENSHSKIALQNHVVIKQKDKVISEQLVAIQQLELSNSGFKETILELEQQVFELVQKNSSLNLEFIELKNESNTIIKNQKLIKIDLQKKIELLVKENDKLALKNINNTSTISGLNNYITQLKVEINRLVNLKWHQKLFGAK